MDCVRVLLVDDNADILRLTRLMLVAAGGWDIRDARTGEEALAIIAVWPPHLVVMDVMMPGLGGLGALAVLRADAATARLPVVFLTASAAPAQVVDYLSAGASAVIGKPFDPLGLSATLLAILLARGLDDAR